MTDVYSSLVVPALTLRLHDIERDESRYRNDCRTGLKCKRTACRFVHDDQRDTYNSAIGELPLFQG